jgi:hypothetical protein
MDQFYVGLGFTYLYFPFTHYDIFGESVGNSYNLSQSLGTLNAGYALKKYNISIGTNLKFYYNRIPEDLYPGQSYFIFAFDLGMISRTNLLNRFDLSQPSLTYGITIKNIGFSKEVERLPTEIHAGASYRLLKNLLITSELAIPFFEPVYGTIGAEFDFSRMFFIEGGIQIKRNPMFAAGLGYQRNNIRLDVSYTPSIAFYNMISVSLTYSFGKKGQREKTEEVDKNLVKATEHFENGNHNEALEVVEQVLELDPENSNAIHLQEEIEAASKW